MENLHKFSDAILKATESITELGNKIIEESKKDPNFWNKCMQSLEVKAAMDKLGKTLDNLPPELTRSKQPDIKSTLTAKDFRNVKYMEPLYGDHSRAKKDFEELEKNRIHFYFKEYSRFFADMGPTIDINREYSTEEELKYLESHRYYKLHKAASEAAYGEDKGQLTHFLPTIIMRYCSWRIKMSKLKSIRNSSFSCKMTKSCKKC